MEVKHQSIDIDINSKIPQQVQCVAHTNDNNTRFVDVALYNSGQKITLAAGCTSKAIFVTNGILINDNVSCTVSNNIIQVPIDKYALKNIIGGLMSVEIVITQGTQVISPSAAFYVRVTNSILNSATLAQQTRGTVADVLKEIEAARGEYNTLSEKINSKLDDKKGSVKSNHIANGAIANINKISSSLIDSAPKQNSTNLITSGAVYKAKNELQTQINNMELQTNMFNIGISVAYDENMNVLKTSTNAILSGGSLSASGTVYVYIPSSVTTIEGGAINFTNLKLIVIDNTQSNATISFSIPETVKVIYTQNLDTVPVALMKMAYANSNIIKDYNDKTNDLQSQINDIALQTDLFNIGLSAAFDENMNVLQTSTNTVLSAGNLYAENTAYVYISSSVVTIQSGVMNFDKLKLIVMDNKRGNINTSIANIPESVKVIYTQNLDTVPTALMKMAYAIKNYYNKTDSKSRFAQGVSAIYDAKGNIVRVCSKTSLSGGDLFGDSSVKTAFVSNNVTSIGSGTFSGCTNLETVYIDNTQSNLEHGGFTIESGAIPFGAEIVYTDEFNGVTHNTEAIASINESVNNLNACAILNETVAFDENGVVLKTSDDTVISGGIFTGNTAIKKVFIPSSVTEIQSGGFYGCSNLTEITIDNVEGQVTISSNAIPENVDIVYTNKFNVVTTLCKAVAMLNNRIETLEAKIKELEK